MSEKVDYREQARKAEIDLTGKRFCTSCQSMQPAQTGKMIEGKRNRWQCLRCTEKISNRKYVSKHKGEGDL